MTQQAAKQSAKAFWGISLLWFVAAALLFAYQRYIPTTIKVTLNTATEVNTAGFYIYRSQEIDGEYILLDDELIPAQGDAITGAEYTYKDRVDRGPTYYYLLEEVELSNQITKLEDDIISYTSINWLELLVTAVCFLMGTIFAVTALKEGKGYDA